MGEIVELTRLDDSKCEQARASMIAALEGLLEEARAGRMASVCFVAIPRGRQSLGFGFLHMPDCGLHEMVGATTMLNDHLRSVVQA